MTDDAEEWADSGPFCRHYSDSDCTEKCATCGHYCASHGGGVDDSEECIEEGCDCRGWMEIDEDAQLAV